MKEVINFSIGFVTGRSNVCNIINYGYNNLLKQFEKLDKNVKLTIFILYDLEYQKAQRDDFYNIEPEAYKNITIKYITPEDIEEEKKKLMSRKLLTKENLELFFGHGHARGRNTVMYFAKKRKMDYLLFWDDDEYPVACVKNENKQIEWIEQANIAEHLKYIDNVDITIGHHCGYISPIPYVEIGEEIDEIKFSQYIKAISNDIISWESIKQKFKENNGVTYANKEIIENKIVKEIELDGIGKWVAGSTICLNLKNIENIPAYYNPPNARGEDTFFSVKLKDCKVLRIPIYHFHDGFLKYRNIMKGMYPKTLRKIKVDEELISQRFISASRGWIKYKPLLLFISNKNTYKEKIKEMQEQLNEGLPEVSKLFKDYDIEILKQDLKEYSTSVEKHYQEYLKTNEIWEVLRKID